MRLHSAHISLVTLLTLATKYAYIYVYRLSIYIYTSSKSDIYIHTLGHIKKKTKNKLSFRNHKLI